MASTGEKETAGAEITEKVEEKTAEKKAEKEPPSLNQQLMDICASPSVTVEEVKELLAKGADAAYEYFDPGQWGAKYRCSPLHKAICGKDYSHVINPEIITLLLESGAKPNALFESYHWTGGGESLTAFQMIISAKSAPIELISLFIKHGADPNIAIKEKKHSMHYEGAVVCAPIHLAVERDSAELVKLLLDAGADVNARRRETGDSDYGLRIDTNETALHLVFNPERKNSLAIAQRLIEKGADVNAIRKFLDNDPIYENSRRPTRVNIAPIQETPLHRAIKTEKADIINLLLHYGADPNILYFYGIEEGKNAWQLVHEKKNDACCQALLRKWTPETHKIFPKEVKDAIVCFLLIANRLNWNLDKSIMHHIFSFVPSSWNPVRPTTPLPEGPKMNEDDD